MWSSFLYIPGVLAVACRAVCLTRLEALPLAAIYQELVSNYSAALAEEYLADVFIDTSDSINTLAGKPLGQPTFDSKAAFMASQASQAPFDMLVTSIDAVDCAAIALRWTAQFGAPDLPVRGISILTTTDVEGYWQISGIDTEFNSLIWNEDMGGSYTLAGTSEST